MFKPLVMLEVFHSHAVHDATTYVISFDDLCMLTLNRREEHRTDEADTNYVAVTKEFGTLQGTLRKEEVEWLLPALEAYEKDGKLASMGHTKGSGSGYWINPERLTGIASREQDGTHDPKVTFHFEGNRQHTFEQRAWHYAQAVKSDVLRMLQRAERIRTEKALRRAQAIAA